MYIQFYKKFPGIDLSKYYFEQEDYKFFGPVKDLNIFIGPNNSGKSRFMRELMKYFKIQIASKDFFKLSMILINKIDEFIKSNAFHTVPIIRYDKQAAIDNQDKRFKELFPENFPFFHSNKNVEYSKAYYKEIMGTAINIQNKLIDQNELNDNINYLNLKLSELEILSQAKKISLSMHSGNSLRIRATNYSDEEYYQKLESIIYLLKDYTKQIAASFLNLKNRIYIPILRSSHNIYQTDGTTRFSQDVFSATTKKNYDLKTNVIEKFSEKEITQTEIFSGMTLYETVHAHNNSEDRIRRRIEMFEEFLSRIFFNSEKVKITALAPSPIFVSQIYTEPTLLFKAGDVEHEIHNYGDGINNIIILLYRLFTCEDESWIFIEEPENSLHPAFQRIFIETILKDEYIKSKNLKVFITTHSNHMLDTSLENSDQVSLFTFERILKDSEELFKIENVSGGDLKILNLLGINNSSIFLANCSVWVEGITDRKYLKAYLKAYMESEEFKGKKFLEDIHYCFFEYAGSNLSHYIFNEDEEKEKEFNEELLDDKIKAKFLSNRIFLLADKDKGKEKKHFDFLKQENINFIYELTEGKEIENLISSELLKLALPQLSTKISLEEAKASIIDQTEYFEFGLGGYLKNLFSDKEINFSSSDKNHVNTEWGTLSDYYKQRLPDIISEHVTWDNMSDSAQKLTKEIYNFIKSHNN